MRWTRPLEILLEIGIAMWLLGIFLKPINENFRDSRSAARI